MADNNYAILRLKLVYPANDNPFYGMGDVIVKKEPEAGWASFVDQYIF